MSSYFVNSTFPVSLPGGQDSLLGQIPLYSSGYTDPLRHYSNAATYGAAANMQEKVYPASYYQQTGAAAAAIYGRAGGGARLRLQPGRDFLQGRGWLLRFLEPRRPAAVCHSGAPAAQSGVPGAELSAWAAASTTSPSTLIYPWMQRMNACSAGEYKRV